MTNNFSIKNLLYFLIGTFVTIFCPGVIQFLSFQKIRGISFYFGYFGFILLFFVVASLPYKFADFLILFLVFIWILFVILFSIVSVPLMKKLYFKGWILLFVGGYFFNILTCYVVGNWFINYVECHLILTTSMSPTLKITSDFHDMVIINKWIYKLREPQRGDIVCFDSDRWLWHVENKIPVGNIKRIIGLPEEIIDIEPPYIMINGERLTEPLIFETISSCQNGYAGYCKNLDNVSAKTIELPITLGKDQYFIMGDNSQHSIDSRIIGVIHKNEIRGKVVRIIYPLSRFKLLD